MKAVKVLLIGSKLDGDLSTFLENSGYTVEKACSSSEVAKHATDTKFNLVFVHLDFPNEAILAYLEDLRRTSKNRATPLIGIIGTDGGELDEVTCLKARIFDYVNLPVVPDKIQQTLRRWIL